MSCLLSLWSNAAASSSPRRLLKHSLYNYQVASSFTCLQTAPRIRNGGTLIILSFPIQRGSNCDHSLYSPLLERPSNSLRRAKKYALAELINACKYELAGKSPRSVRYDLFVEPLCGRNICAACAGVSHIITKEAHECITTSFDTPLGNTNAESAWVKKVCSCHPALAPT